MATFGAYLRLSNGNIFVTPEATPMCLYTRQDISCPPTQNTSRYIAVPINKPVMVFVKTSIGGVTASVSRANSGQILCAFGRDTNNTYTATVYVFSIFSPSLPEWGMAIWNASGELVLTNESRILTDIVTVGSPGNSGGINIDQTLSGSYAICPQLLGAVVGQGSASIYAAAYYNGINTRIYGVTAGGVFNPTGYINHGNAITAIKTNAYD
ncbi:TPA: hypothetical protein ACGRWC_000544 [Escherichia coli]